MTQKTSKFSLFAPVTIPGWVFSLMIMIIVVQTANNLKTFVPDFRSGTFESQVRQWASDYPNDLLDRWAWCYLDSVEQWSTDQKLREDVRLKSVKVLTDSERQTLVPLDDKIAEAIPKQTTPLKETYQAVGDGLKVTEWTPPTEIRPPDPPEPQPKPQPPNRRRIFRR